MDRLTFDGCFCEIAQCTEFSCEMGICSPRQVWERLKAYEDAEEQDLLLKLPCKVGDTVYKIGEEYVKVDTLMERWEKHTFVKHVKFKLSMLGTLGKTVFLTPEEAEAAMKGE